MMILNFNGLGIKLSNDNFIKIKSMSLLVNDNI